MILEKKNGKIWLRISVCGFVIWSMSFVLIPLMSDADVHSLRYFPGVLFWVGLLSGIVGQVALEMRRRRFFTRNHANWKKYQKRRCGLLSWFSNKVAKTADIALFACSVGLILCMVLSRNTADICFVFAALTAFSFTMHCILNGRNYFFINNLPRIQLALEQRRKSKERKK